MESFDVIIIGSGSGLDVANALARQDMKVAIIERNKMGGTCLNSGCIPSKLLIHSADILEIIKNSHQYKCRKIFDRLCKDRRSCK
jgi:mycothione reductase